MFILLLVVPCLIPTELIAGTCGAYTSLEMWAEQDIQLVGVDASLSRCLDRYIEVRGGLSYYADSEFLYKGVTGSWRFRFGRAVSPYVGVGVLAGFGEKEVEANNDGIDNDDDGFVDEADEEKTLYDASIYAYPEVGLEVMANGYGLMLSARKYYGREFDGNLIFSIGFTAKFGR